MTLECPECSEPIEEINQVRCSNCKILFDWEDEDWVNDLNPNVVKALNQLVKCIPFS